MSAPASILASLPPAPERALDERGRPRWGAFAGEAGGAEEVGREGGFLARAVRRKRWVFVWMAGPRATAGIAVGDVGYLGQAFVFAYDRERKGAPVERGWLAPLGVGFRITGGLRDLYSGAFVIGRRKVEIRAEGQGLRCQAELGDIRLDARVEGLETPMTVITDLAPEGGGNPCATVKAAGVPSTGTLTIEGRAIDLAGSFATVDWSAGRFPYRMKWNWGALGGLDARGRPVGLNLCRGVHEERAGRWTENALWLEGRPAALPPVRFDVGAGEGDPWRVRSADGAVDLEVRPFCERRAVVNLGVISSSFRHPFGTYHGKVRDLDGRSAELDGAVGMVEDHTARW